MPAPDPELLDASREIVETTLEEKLEQKLDQKFDERLAPITRELRSLNRKVDDNSRRLDLLVDHSIRLGTEMIGVNTRLDRIDGRMDNFLLGPLGDMLRTHDRRIVGLERVVGVDPGQDLE